MRTGSIVMRPLGQALSQLLPRTREPRPGGGMDALDSHFRGNDGGGESAPRRLPLRGFVYELLCGAIPTYLNWWLRSSTGWAASLVTLKTLTTRLRISPLSSNATSP